LIVNLENGVDIAESLPDFQGGFFVTAKNSLTSADITKKGYPYG
jgi:hypothetical protein